MVQPIISRQPPPSCSQRGKTPLESRDMLGAKGYDSSSRHFRRPPKRSRNRPDRDYFSAPKCPNPPPAPRPHSQHRSPSLRRTGGDGHVGDHHAPRPLGVPPRHPQGRRASSPLRRQLRLFCPQHRHRKRPGLPTLFPDFPFFFRRADVPLTCVLLQGEVCKAIICLEIAASK